MNRSYLTKGNVCAALLLATILPLPGQEKPAAEPKKTSDTEEVVELSPFVVSGAEDTGYEAKYSLAGTRIRTDIKDVGSSITIVTSKFLADTGTTNATQLLVYTPNTEVVGPGGNFLGAGDAKYVGAVRYGQSRVRGLSNADTTRDFFLSDIPWDSYNTGRIDIQRGPNSILFGIGSPAGIINASINHASFKNSNTVQNKLDNFGTVRFSGDFNQVLIDKQLAIRISLLDDSTKYRQKPAFRDDKRFFGAMRWDPAFLNKGSMHTSFEASFEKGEIDSNLPREAPPTDYLTPWFNELKGFQANGLSFRTASQVENSPAGQRFGQGADLLTQGGTIVAYLQGNSTGLAYPHNAGEPLYTGTGYTVGIGGYGEYGNRKARLPGYTIGAWRPLTINDRSIFDSYNILLDGNTKGEFNHFDALSAAFRQSFKDDTIGYELAYDRQHIHSGEHHFLGDAGYGIAIDAMGTLAGGIIGGTPNPAGGTYADVADPINPNLGKAYVVGARGSGFSWHDNEKTTYRGTGFYNLNFKKLTGNDSLLGRLFGENRFTVLASQFRDTSKSANGGDYYTGDNYEPNRLGPTLDDEGRNTYILDYLSNRKLTGNTASGLNLPGLDGLPKLATNTMINRWNSTTKSWYQVPFDLVTNFDLPEEQRAYGGASLSRRTVNTTAAVWQGYWLDGTIIPMMALRKDTSFFNDAGTAPNQKIGNLRNYYPFDPAFQLQEKGPTSGVTSRTYSIVTHTPKKWREKLPGNMDIQLIYNQSENFQPKPGRVDIYNRAIPDPSGRTKEYGVAVSALHDKLYLKVVHYETHEENADIGLSGNLGAFAAMEVWARCAAYVHSGKQGPVGTPDVWQADTIYGISSDGHQVTFKPYGPWATSLGPNQPGPTVWDGRMANEPYPVGTVRTAYTQAEIDATWAGEKAAIDAIMNNPPPDSFIAATKIDRAAFFSASGPGMFDYDGGGGSASAVITGSTVSKGTEIELVANPIAGLSIVLNASKTEAKRTSIAQSYLDYIKLRRPFFYGPAGDMRIWGSGWADLQLDPYTTAGNGSMSVAFRSQVDSPISLYLASENTKVPELKPWAFNMIANYAFQSDGILKGFNVGGGYRWQDKQVTGYPVAKDSLGIEYYDVTKPFFGPTEATFDGWIGYSRKISRKLAWRTQLNVRNIFANDKLIRTNVNPDGTGAAYRIPEPRTITLTNTFEF